MAPDSASGNQSSPTPSWIAHETAFSQWLSSKEDEARLQRIAAQYRESKEGAGIVMIVDDEHVVAITLAEILQRRGVNAIWFTEPLAALEYARANSIELLISDLTMPLMDGVHLARQVRKAIPECRLFLFSAISEQPAFTTRMQELGSDIHVEAKPLQIARLLSTVQHLLSPKSACLSTA